MTFDAIFRMTGWPDESIVCLRLQPAPDDVPATACTRCRRPTHWRHEQSPGPAFAAVAWRRCRPVAETQRGAGTRRTRSTPFVPATRAATARRNRRAARIAAAPRQPRLAQG